MSLDQEVMRARARYTQQIQLCVFPPDTGVGLIDVVDHAMADVIEATRRDTLAQVLHQLADQLSPNGANTLTWAVDGLYINGRKVD